MPTLLAVNAALIGVGLTLLMLLPWLLQQLVATPSTPTTTHEHLVKIYG